MKRVLALVLPATLLALAGCGGDTCSSAPAPLQNTQNGKQCDVTPGQLATFTVQLCGKCTDSAAACQAEFVNGQIEIAPVVQQCQAQRDCAITPGCAVQAPTATCSLTIPSSVTTGTPIAVVASDQNGSPVVVTGTVTTNGGGSCTL